jgi:DNA-binding MarR family transcriptional regulator
MASTQSKDAGIRMLTDINRMVHEPARLMILMYLYTLESADFVFLLRATELTWGNLSSHLTKLEEAGYVEIEKGYMGKRPRTMVQLTDAGRQAIQSYRDTMKEALSNLTDE